MQDKRVQFAYNALDQITFISRYENLDGTGTILRSVYNYDQANRMTGLTHRNIPTSGGATILADYSFQYDTMNRITSLTHTGSPGGVSDGTSTFSYDLTSQLTGADHTPARPDEAYQYDLNGNRNSAGYTTGTNNQTLNDGTYSYQFDKEGNRTRRTKLSDNSYEEYSWDHRNRLTNVTLKSQSSTVVSTVNYSYDIFNRLIKRSHDSNGPTAGGVLDTFFAGYDGINPTLELSKANPGSGGVAATDLKHRYLWGPIVDQLFADEQITSVSSAGNTLWALGDQLGTLRDIVDYNPGTTTFGIANHRTYDSFGRLTAESNSAIDLAFGYTGKYFDEATGLSNHWNRWFDPQLGKWVSEDPIGFVAGDTNLGRYVANSATASRDPFGLAAFSSDDEWHLDLTTDVNPSHGGPHIQKGNLRWDAVTFRGLPGEDGNVAPPLTRGQLEEIRKAGVFDRIRKNVPNSVVNQIDDDLTRATLKQLEGKGYKWLTKSAARDVVKNIVRRVGLPLAIYFFIQDASENGVSAAAVEVFIPKELAEEVANGVIGHIDERIKLDEAYKGVLKKRMSTLRGSNSPQVPTDDDIKLYKDVPDWQEAFLEMLDQADKESNR